jgi:chromosome partitioning protein
MFKEANQQALSQKLNKPRTFGLHPDKPKIPKKRPHIIVLGNEKGGSGKSTTAMHVIVSLLMANKKVAAIDLDSRQKSLTRYLENRRDYCERNNIDLPFPKSFVAERSDLENLREAETQEREAFEAILDTVSGYDFIVIDSPGSDTHLSRVGHSVADTLITPLNDSFVDFDLLAEINSDTFEVLGPSLYSELVWESRKNRAMNERASIDWVVMRNRVSSLDAKNKRRVFEVLNSLAPRIGFRIAPGFGERVIFRELFPTGQTLMDLAVGSPGFKMSMSHVAARQEVRDLINMLKLPGIGDEAVEAEAGTQVVEASETEAPLGGQEMKA